MSTRSKLGMFASMAAAVALVSGSPPDLLPPDWAYPAPPKPRADTPAKSKAKAKRRAKRKARLQQQRVGRRKS
jgi:hypothetical protein